jgi:hypothetical protein
LEAADESIDTSARVGHGIRPVVFGGVEIDIGVDRCVGPRVIRRPTRVACAAVGVIRRSIRVACAPAGIDAHVTRTRDIGNDGTVRIPGRMRVSTTLRHLCGIDHATARIGLCGPRVGGAGRVEGSGVPRVAAGCVVKNAVRNRRVTGIALIRRRQSRERSSTAERR